MPSKAQHARIYRAVPPFVRRVREEAGLTQRAIAQRLGKPQSWVYNCETANRRMDVSEFVAWCEACGVKPIDAFSKLLKLPR